MNRYAACLLVGLSALVAAAVPTSRCAAQAAFVEGFDDLGPTNYSLPGPQVLMDRGWVFRNQSQPVGSRGYFAGILPGTNSIYFPPQSGAGYLAADGGSTGQFGGTMSLWALLPAVPNQQSGDAVTIWARRLSGPASLEIRYSPTGNTSTGASVTDVGAFTTLLVDINPVPVSGWTKYSAVVPGNGRLALRYRGTFQFGGFNPYIGIDSLSVGPPPPPPCNLPPVPQPGQTATWTLAGSPYRVCENISIPAGATVNVEPGVVVDFDSGRQLGVAGTLNINATASAPVILSAPNIYPPFILVTGGTINAAFTDFRQQVRISDGANVLLSDCTFVSDGSNTNGGALASDDIPVPYPYVRLERCTFSNSSMTLSNCLAVLRNNTFTDSYALLLRTLADVTAPNTFNGQPLQINRQDSLQPLRVDGVIGTGAPSGLSLDGGAYLLGAANNFHGNTYPIDLNGGLMHGSVLPSAGNTVNAVNVHEASFAGYGTWPDLGIPYRITEQHGSLPGGDLTIDPGVRVESLAGYGILVRSTRRLIADGLPDAPITFRAVNPSQPWQGLAFATNGTSGPRLEYCNILDASIGVVSSDNTLYADNCLFDGNLTGASTGSGNIFFRKSLFTRNQIGANKRVELNSQSNPNAFENNAMAVEGTFGVGIDARSVWWNSPTGPRHPSNPGGTGELVGGEAPGNVQVIPFLTSRPDFANTPPVVRMTEPGIRWNGAQVNADYLLEPGSRHILRWEARDNVAIASQRVVLSGDGHYPDRFTITLAANLPPEQRSLEFTVPEVGYAFSNSYQFIRVIAVDDAGQEGWDQTPCVIPSGRMSGSLTITNESDFAGLVFRPGDEIPDMHWTGSVNNFPTLDPMIVLESDGATVVALPFSGGVGMFFMDFPFVSTDRARLAIRARGNSNDVIWFYADSYFSIRHDARMNYTPPAVEITSPAPGAAYPGGSIVPIAWTGSAPEGFYSFDIQGSYDGGRTWHLVAQELPASARSYAWRLPSSDGLSDVRVRVVGRDLRFQNSSDDAGFDIAPGTFCRADYNGDGFVDGIDYDNFNNDFEAGSLGADYNLDGFVDGIDYDLFNNDFEAGC